MTKNINKSKHKPKITHSQKTKNGGEFLNYINVQSITQNQKKEKEKQQTKNPKLNPKKSTAVREDFQGHLLECFFCFSFFPEKKKMPFFWLLFLGKQK
ncbi:MAG: hypothetical protein R3Y27_08025, partial [Clostridia bacterium]